ncbi:hypothetical protein HDU76_008207, partial [Blyttiomyces sp. JEL0837]
QPIKIPYIPGELTLQKIKDGKKTFPIIEGPISNLSPIHPQIQSIINSLQSLKLCCFKSSLTKFQALSLDEYSDYIWYLKNKEVKHVVENEIATIFTIISGDFHQYDLSNNLGTLDRNVRSIVTKKSDLMDVNKEHLITRDVFKIFSMIENCKLAILQILKGFVAFFIKLLEFCHADLKDDIKKYLQVTGLAFLFADQDSFDQLPHSDGIDQLRLSLLIAWDANGQPTQHRIANDTIPFINTIPFNGSPFEFEFDSYPNSVNKDPQQMNWFKNTFQFLSDVENVLYNLEKSSIATPIDQYSFIMFLGNTLHYGQGLSKVGKIGVEKKLFLQLGVNKSCLSSDFQVTPYHYFAHTKGIDNKETLFVWDVVGRPALQGTQYDHYELWGNLILEVLGLDTSHTLKHYIPPKREEFKSFRDTWFAAFDNCTSKANEKFEEIELDDEYFAGFVGEVEDGTTLVENRKFMESEAIL